MYKGKVALKIMTIRNYRNPTDDTSKQLYEVSYSGHTLGEEIGKVHLIATDLDDAVEMFCGFYKTSVPNPKDIPERDELDDIDIETGKRAITGIEKVTNAVLTRIEQQARKR